MKKYLIHLVLNAFLILLLAHSAFCQARSDNIEVLIVDGFSNHDWKQTTQVVKSILEKTNLFTVSISTAPSEPDHEDWSRWDPNFRDYDVVIQNTNNIHNEEIKWPRKVLRTMCNRVVAYISFTQLIMLSQIGRNIIG